jgi:hypothetical protein
MLERFVVCGNSFIDVRVKIAVNQVFSDQCVPDPHPFKMSAPFSDEPLLSYIGRQRPSSFRQEFH